MTWRNGRSIKTSGRDPSIIWISAGIGANSHDFTKSGKEKGIDCNLMFQCIHNQDFHGYMGIDYEG